MAEEDEEQRYQKEMRKRVAEAMRRAQMEQQKKDVMRQFLEPDAYERLMNIRVSNPELYDQLVGMVVSLVQSNRVTGKISEKQLRSILEKITYRKEPNISFKHK
jgi:programmed cell death protein 5